MKKLAACAGDQGLWASRSYFGLDPLQLGSVLVVSNRAAGQARYIFEQCVNGSSPAPGGPGFETPCFDTYHYAVGDIDSFSVAVVGYPSSFCENMRSFHAGWAGYRPLDGIG